MSVSLADRLYDAIESGDILELEECIRLGREFLQQGNSNSNVRSLTQRAERVFAKYMELCRPYIRPLRRACQQLSERDIYDCLARIHHLPPSVQLHMYSDIRKAEALREDILAAQEEALRVLDCSSWRVVDRFLTESACALEDRTVLALVQKREDLLKQESKKVRDLSRNREKVVSPIQRDLPPSSTEPAESSAVHPRGSSLFNSVNASSSPQVAKPSSEEAQYRQKIEAEEQTQRKTIYKLFLTSKFPFLNDVAVELPTSPTRRKSPLKKLSPLQNPIVPTVTEQGKSAIPVERLERSRPPPGTPDISPIRGQTANFLPNHSYSRLDPLPVDSEKRERVSSVGEKSLTTTNRTIDENSTFQTELVKRKWAAKVRAVLQEEDIHRRDIEGTEEFDRNVFLNPLFTRISLDIESYQERQSRLAVY